MTFGDVPTPTVQPIQYVTNPEQWRTFWLTLGLEPTKINDPVWTVLAAPSGRVAIHDVDEDDPLAGTTQLTLEVPDLGAYAAAVRARGMTVTEVTIGHGDALTVDLPHGTLLVNRAQTTAGTTPASPDRLSVLGLVYGDDVSEGAQIAATLGLQPRISSDRGAWADLTAHGIVAFHRDDDDSDRSVQSADGAILCDLVMEIGDIDEIHQRLEHVGHPARIIDEAYARTLRVDTPDGNELWINETIRDLYGFRKERAAWPPASDVGIRLL